LLLEWVKSSLAKALTEPRDNPLNPQQTIHAVICYVFRESDRKYLLIHKVRGKFGGGFWNGPGGKIEPSESPEEAVKREVFEETGLEVSELKNVGLLEFYFGSGKKEPDWTAVVFRTTSFKGKLRSRTEEGTLRWIEEDQLPLERMWEDDRYWIPLLLKGIRFKGTFEFTADAKKITSYKLEKLES
jgi:8-oxo-dGTP diphosphatase